MRPSLLSLGVVVPLGCFLALGLEIRDRRVPSWDSHLARTVRDLPVRFPDDLLHVERDASVVLALLVLVLVVRHRLRAAIIVVVSAGGALALDLLLKPAFPRLDEIGSSTLAYPSGHALLSFATSATIVMLLWPTRWRVATAAAAGATVLINALALVDSQWHEPSDVIGGWLLGAAWVSAVWLGASFRPRRPRRAGARPGDARDQHPAASL
jgi:membrane-associated phospholipid phosphatase